jgi:hypothetical protein
MVLVDEQVTAEQTWQRYEAAFQEFSRKVARVQFLSAQPDADRAAMDAGLLDLEKARVVYNECRDAWANRLLPLGRALPASGELAAQHPERVKELAELLWEVAGRPAGTADHDWYRAEEIVRRVKTEPVSV